MLGFAWLPVMALCLSPANSLNPFGIVKLQNLRVGLM
jgi:hypothetical protein